MSRGHWPVFSPVRSRLLLASLLAVAAVVVVFLLPSGLLFGAPYTDLIHQFVAWRAFAAENLRAGHLPLWNPYTYAGPPFLGGFQSALLYPPNLIFIWLPLDRALNLSALLHLLILGWGMAYWASRRGFHPWAAGLTGFVLPLSGAVFPHLYAGHLPNLCTMAWAPWVFAGLEDWSRRGKSGGALLASAAICLQILGGQVQYVFFTAVAAGLVALVSTAAVPSARRRALPAIVLCYCAAAALAAAQLFPGFAAASEGIRQGALDYDFAGMFSLPPENLLSLLAPGFFGTSDILAQPYWGRAYPWEMSVFVGVSGLLLVGVALQDRAHRRSTLLDLGVAALLGLLALGRHTPLFRLLYEYVPGFDRFRGLSKFTFPATLFVVLTIGAGADALIRQRFVPRLLAQGALWAGLAVGGAGLFLRLQPEGLSGIFNWVRARPESDLPAEMFSGPGFLHHAGVQAGHSLLVAGAVLFLVGLSLLLARKYPRLRWVPLLLLPLEMIGFASANFATTPLAAAVPAELHEFIAAQPGDYRVLDLLSPNNGFLLGAPDLWGNDPGVLKRYAEFITFTQGGDPGKATQYVAFKNFPPLYAMLRCRYAIAPSANGAQVKELPAPMAQAQLVADYRVLPGRDAIFSALSQPDFDPRRTVLLEREPDPRPTRSGPPGTVRILAASTDALTLEADVTSPALLLMTDLYSRDWHARPLAGSVQKDYRVLPADYVLRAVPLSAGHHHLRVEYVPRGFMAGIVVSAVAWLLWFGIACWRYRASRQMSGRSADGIRA